MAIADLTDVQCYYEMQGQGPPVLLIPGLGGTCRVWDPVKNELTKQFSVICVDNRGIGQSIARRPARTLRDYSADLIELLDTLQVDQTHVIGLSLGGVIAQRLAIDHPSRIKRLVLVSCAHQFGPYLREMSMLLAQTLRRFPRKLFARTMQVLGGGPLYLDADPKLIDRHVEEVNRAAVPASDVIRQLRCLGASNPETSEYQIKAQTLVLAGEHDALIPHCYARQMADAIPDSNFMLATNAGHNPFSECPDKVMPTIIRFLRDGKYEHRTTLDTSASGKMCHETVT